MNVCAVMGPADAGAAPRAPASPGCMGAAFAGLRIGLVGPLPPPAGGMANQTRQLAELLRAEGAQVELVQTNAPYRPAIVGRVPVLRALFRLAPYLAALWHAAGSCDVFHVMANSGWSWHLFAAPAVRLAALRGVAVVVNYRGGEAGVFLDRASGSVARTLRRASALVVPSGFLADVFARHRIRAVVVPNIVDLQRFRPATQRTPGAQILVARNLEPLYDNATALRAFGLVRQSLPEARLVIAGSGPQESDLRRLARDLGLADAVHFTGRLDRDAMAQAYRDADVALNPSLVDNMPNSVLEALASGVPVVSTDVGGVPFIVEHERTALLVSAGDAPRMAQALLRVLREPALRERLRDAGLEQARHYTWIQVAPRLAGVYRDALARGARGGPRQPPAPTADQSGACAPTECDD